MANAFKHNLELLFLLFTLVDCNPKMKTTEWLPTECAPAGYPMTIIKAALIDGEGKHISVPEGKILNNGWGEQGSTRILNETNTIVPEKLEVEWFSYTENKFYKGSVNLPADLLATYFTEGFISPDTKSKQDYDLIKVGVAPGGFVSVWISGEAITKEVLSTRVEETAYEWSKFFDNPDMSREKYIESTLKNTLGDSAYQKLINNPRPDGFWMRYQQKYTWKPQLIGLNASHEIIFKTFNGESEYIFTESPDNSTARGVIKDAEVRWSGPSNQKFMAKVQFDEEEIFAAFTRLTSKSTTEPLLLKFEIGNADASLRISLANGSSFYELTKCITRIYSL